MLTIESFNDNIIKNKKVAVISHNDLDCSGSIIICDKLFMDYKYLTVANSAVDKMVKLVIYGDAYKDRELIFITDVSIVSGELAETITSINLEGKRRIFLFDHHDTALWLNKYDWAVVTNEPGVSASRLFFNYMSDYIQLESNTEVFRFLDELTRCISDWDTWEWVKKGLIGPKDLATLFSKTGIKYFVKKFAWCHSLLTENDKALLEDIADKQKFVILPSIKKTARNITMQFDYIAEGNFLGLELKTPKSVVKVVKCVSVSEAPNDLAELLYEDGIDYIFMFYSNGTVSCRSRIEDVHLGHWCKYIAGGGGHSMSAGFQLTMDTLWIYDLYLKERYKEEE